jgi:hypothetical protein
MSGWMRMMATVGLAVFMAGPLRAADQFMKPTAEELAMKSLPGYPGAAAVVLYREQITKDDMHVVQHYDRIKVLTEEGKKYANVELRFVSTTDDGSDVDFGGDNKSLGEVAGRTIHPDGTVIPFTGKPYKKTMEKVKGAKYQALVFTLPDVEVGSILEYRYATRINDNIFEAPDWYIQGELYVKSAHFSWFPTSRDLLDQKERHINSIMWFPILPQGAKIEDHETPAIGKNGASQRTYDLVVKDVPPEVEEDHMPPIASFSYRVLFSMTAYRSAADFWKSEGKEWAKRSDSFANPNDDLRKQTEAVIAGAATQDEKLRKIYAAVMKLENTDYTRAHEQREDKAAGAGKLNSVADVLHRERGSSGQLTSLFVGMARAAGMKAYLMLVPDRSEELFTPMWLNFRQFDATIAVVNVDGKDVFFDPGSRYCSYGRLAWEHTQVQGLREVDGGTDFGQTPGENYTVNKVLRVADLEMNEQGEVSGKATLTYIGAPALAWRHRALRGDDESLKHALRTEMEDMLPKSMDVKVEDVKDVNEYEKPLVVTYALKGKAGTPTGKRLMLPVDLFEVGSSPAFPHEKRELPVYFRYPEMMQDAVRVKFEKGYAIEVLPEAAKFDIPSKALYNMSITSTPTSFTSKRNYVNNSVLTPLTEYETLRKFYSQFENTDKASVVLKVAPVQAALATPSTN